jgi:adenosylcobinamide-phosphate synthase
VSGAALLFGYAADLALGDPPRLHPVAGFGRMALAAERIGYAPTRTRGATVTAVLVLAAAGGAEALARRGSRSVALGGLGWAALGGRSLRREAGAVAGLVEAGDLPGARQRLRSLCGRDADELDAVMLRRAVVESLAENTADAVVGALLWAALLGPAGLAAYRAVNTLDAMFGHRSERYERFGWAAARLDDVVNWPVARLTALLTLGLAPFIGGSPSGAARAWRRDAPAHPSPNAGTVESAFAGALGVELGGPLAYGGRGEERPLLGTGGRAPQDADVRRAARLSALVGAAAALSCALVREAITR